MSEKKTALKSCPFCGGAGFMKDLAKPFRHGWVGCPVCQCYISFSHDPAGAVEKWNRRAE